MCGQPKSMCKIGAGRQCEYKDVVVPGFWAVATDSEQREWLRVEWGVERASTQEYMVWGGEAATIGDERCIRAAAVVAKALAMLT